MGEELMRRQEGIGNSQEKDGESIPIPESAKEAIEMHRETIEHEMLNDFGLPEVPKQILAEMEHILRAIDAQVREKGYMDECDDAVMEQLRALSVKVAHFKEDPEKIKVAAIPEAGYTVSFDGKSGAVRERAMTEDEQDLLFQLEMWADQMNGLKNIEAFKANREAIEKRAKTKPESERSSFVLEEMQKKYERFGFTPDQVRDLLLVSEEGEIDWLVPEGEDPGLHKLKVLRQIWDTYLSDQEKSRYVKLAAGLTVAGAVEGIAPTLIGQAMDAPTATSAALFALGYLGIEAGTSWVRRALSVDFDQLMQDIMQKQQGLNQQLARDLAFQPGERMTKGEDRGKILETLKRSQEAFQDILYSVARTQAPAVASTAMGLTMMMANDWRLGLISLASAPIAVAISRRNERKRMPLVEKSYEKEGEVAQEVEDQLLAHQDIVLSGMREQMAGRLEELSKQKGDLAHQRRVAREDMYLQSSTLNAGVFAALTAGGAALREMGVEQSGAIVTALVYSGMFRNSWDQIVYSNNSLLDSLKSIQLMEEIFNGYANAEVEADEQRIGASEIEEFSFELDHVSLAFENEKIVDDVSFRVPAGGVVRLEGKSGHGKTTLTRLMSGYYQPTQGAVRIGGHPVSDVKKAGPDSLYSKMAYLSQHPYIFDSGSVKENLLFGNPGASEQDMANVLEELGLARRFRKGGMLNLDEKPRGLSGGEKARLGLARVLLKIRSQENGGVVFLDQATEELDEQTEADVARILLKEKRERPNTTFVIISHREEFMEALANPEEGEGLEIQSVRLEHGKLSHQ